MAFLAATVFLELAGFLVAAADLPVLRPRPDREELRAVLRPRPPLVDRFLVPAVALPVLRPRVVEVADLRFRLAASLAAA